MGGNLGIVAGRITGESNSRLAILATGDVNIAASGVAPVVPAERALGASLSVAGSSIVDAGRIDLDSGLLTLHALGAAHTAGVTLTSTASVNAAGQVLHFGDKDVYARAGDVTLISDHGSVSLGAGSIVDVSAPAAGGDAGSLSISAVEESTTLAGTLRGSAAHGAGGSFTLDAGSVDSFSVINTALVNAGFDGDLAVRARTGNLDVATGDTVRGEHVRLTADTGDMRVAGRIDASGAKAGSIELNAGHDISVRSGASLDAHSTGAGNRGGDVSLRSVDGAVRIASGSTVNVSAAPSTGESGAATTADRGGTLNVRVTREVAATLADADTSNDRLQIAGTVSGARRVNLEAYARYTDDGTLDSTDVATAGNPLFDDATAFVDTNGAGIRSALGAIASQASFHLLPGIEIVTDTSAADLTLANTWDLSRWRFNGEAGVLTLRAAGNLDFTRSLSDGFDGVADLTSNALPVLRTDDSWSYRLVAGADTASADLMATASNQTTGNLSVSPGIPGVGTGRARLVAIRTGTGSIDIAAAGDVTLGNRASVIYTAGRDTQDGIRLGSGKGTLENRPYPLQGGDISVRAGGSVRGVSPDLRGDLNAYGTQLFTQWLYRQGAADETATGSTRRATGWTVAFERFEQGIGALGGGNVSVDAGGTLDNLAVSIPSIGMQVGGTTAETSDVRVVGGGDLTVHAGDDIQGGLYFVGRGDANIRSDASVVSGRAIGDSFPADLHTVLALGEGHITLDARGRLDLETIVNPTLLPQTGLQRNLLATRNSYFSTYGDDSGVTLSSLAGDVHLFNDSADIAAARVFNGYIDQQSGEELNSSLQYYPPILDVFAMRGDIQFDRGMTLYPSAAGDLQLLANGSVFLNGNFSLSDIDPASLGTVGNPTPSVVKFDVLAPGLLQFGTTPVHAEDTGGPARIIARNGDIVRTAPDSVLVLAKKTVLSAGRNLIGVNALIQNVKAGDVSELIAGGDLLYPSLRSPGGQISPGDGGIDIQGPGRLLVDVAGNIDLGASRGITSLGDTGNPALADLGADIILIGGLNGHQPEVAAFAAKYDVNADLPAVLDKFYDILREAGRRNAPLPNEKRSYADAFEAIKTLFPASDYKGSMDLFFSRVYTLDGGDIDVLMPGGGVNVGLAAPPSSFGIKKDASQLGIVAQSFGNVRAFIDQNFEVNESRVFAADGGDILVWSSNGDIDAGRGAKTSISAPPPIITRDPKSGAVSVTFPPALAGSGIRTLTSTPGRPFGSVDLITPRGVVDASEAGIETLGNLTIAAVQVLGTQNIKVGGVSTGVPVDTGGLAASLASVSAVSSSAAVASSDIGASADKTSQAPIADSAMSFLEVFVLGFGEGVCDAKDLECLKRQQGGAQK